MSANILLKQKRRNKYYNNLDSFWLRHTFWCCIENIMVGLNTNSLKGSFEIWGLWLESFPFGAPRHCYLHLIIANKVIWPLSVSVPSWKMIFKFTNNLCPWLRSRLLDERSLCLFLYPVNVNLCTFFFIGIYINNIRCCWVF